MTVAPIRSALPGLAAHGTALSRSLFHRSAIHGLHVSTHGTGAARLFPSSQSIAASESMSTSYCKGSRALQGAHLPLLRSARAMATSLPTAKAVKVALFSMRPEMKKLTEQLSRNFEIHTIEPILTPQTADLARGCNVASAFVNDDLSAATIEKLAGVGIECIAMRCIGYDRVDVEAAKKHNIAVLRVPTYSPYAVAEHTIALIMALNRNIVKAHDRVMQGNFQLSGLVGFIMHGKVVGVIGSGKIGRCTARILKGFGCEVLAYDPFPNQEMTDIGATFVSFEELLSRADVLTLHCPLTAGTHHLIDEAAISQMRPGVMLINVSRGGLIDTPAVIDALDTRKIGSFGADVLECEQGSFFNDLSAEQQHPGASMPVNWNPRLSGLVARPNVIVTPHTGFLTQEALNDIATTTEANLFEFSNGGPYTNAVEA